VIVVGPQLKLHQCGLPKKMALELSSLYFNKLELLGTGYDHQGGQAPGGAGVPEVWDILEEVIR